VGGGRRRVGNFVARNDSRMTRIRADSNCHSARVPRDRESAHSRLTAAGSEAEVVGGFDGGQESAPG